MVEAELRGGWEFCERLVARMKQSLSSRRRSGPESAEGREDEQRKRLRRDIDVSKIRRTP